MTSSLLSRVLRGVAIYARLDMLVGIAMTVTLLAYLTVR
jgi:hypothetical protein